MPSSYPDSATRGTVSSAHADEPSYLSGGSPKSRQRFQLRQSRTRLKYVPPIAAPDIGFHR